jgi:predicted hydrocarbon binding protein
MARVKGFALRGLLKSVKDSGGSIPAVLAALPEAERAAFARPIVTSEWYPYAAFAALVRAVDRIQGKGDLTYARELGRSAAARDLGTTFRIISTVASPKFLIERGAMFWSKYCDAGSLRLDASRDKFFSARLEGFPEIDAAHCLLIEGWLEGLGKALGAVGMASRQVRCVHRGDPICEFEGKWDADKPGGWLG